jgi:hypothetical protein
MSSLEEVFVVLDEDDPERLVLTLSPRDRNMPGMRSSELEMTPMTVLSYGHGALPAFAVLL